MTIPLLLVNLARNDNHWLGIHLIGVVSNRDGIGARVVVHGSGSGRVWVDEVRSGSSYSSNNDMRLHFGLGHATSVGSIEVRWPNGKDGDFSRGRGRSNDFSQGRFGEASVTKAHSCRRLFAAFAGFGFGFDGGQGLAGFGIVGREVQYVL